MTTSGSMSNSTKTSYATTGYCYEQHPSSLPQRAGRVYKKFKRLLIARLEVSRQPVAPTPRTFKGKSEYQVHVYGQVQPEVDIDGLTKVVMMLGRQIQEDAQKSADDNK